MKKISLFLALLLVGCASGPTGKPPVVNANEPFGEIFVIRENAFIGGGMSVYITVDGVDIFAIRVGQYTKFKLPVGQHSIGVKSMDNWGYTWDEQDYKEINVSAGLETYFVIDLGFTGSAIKKVDKKEGIEMMKENEYISMDQ